MRRRLRRAVGVAGCRIRIDGTDPVHVDAIVRLVRDAVEGYGFYAPSKPTGGSRPPALSPEERRRRRAYRGPDPGEGDPWTEDCRGLGY